MEQEERIADLNPIYVTHDDARRYASFFTSIYEEHMLKQAKLLNRQYEPFLVKLLFSLVKERDTVIYINYGDVYLHIIRPKEKQNG